LAGDLKALIEHLDLSGVVLRGFSVSCVEVTRYLVTSGSERVRKPPFGAIPPHLLNTDNDPEGVEGMVFVDIEAAVADNRYTYFEDSSTTSTTSMSSVVPGSSMSSVVPGSSMSSVVPGSATGLQGSHRVFRASGVKGAVCGASECAESLTSAGKMSRWGVENSHAASSPE
jgi:hypothetical protein